MVCRRKLFKCTLPSVVFKRKILDLKCKTLRGLLHFCSASARAYLCCKKLLQQSSEVLLEIFGVWVFEMHLKNGHKKFN